MGKVSLVSMIFWTKLKNLHSAKQVVTASWSAARRYSCNSSLLNGFSAAKLHTHEQVDGAIEFTKIIIRL